MNSFAMDMPHRGSPFKSQYMKQMNTTNSMDTLYKTFQNDLLAMYNNTKGKYQIPICVNVKNVNIYQSIY